MDKDRISMMRYCIVIRKVYIYPLTFVFCQYVYVNVLLSVYDVFDDGAWLWWLVWLLDVNTGLLSIVGKYACMYMHIITIYIHIFTLTSFLYMYYIMSMYCCLCTMLVMTVLDYGDWYGYLMWTLACCR